MKTQKMIRLLSRITRVRTENERLKAENTALKTVGERVSYIIQCEQTGFWEMYEMGMSTLDEARERLTQAKIDKEGMALKFRIVKQVVMD
jgi:hypothetical protein